MSRAVVRVGRLTQSDRADWDALFRGYLDFYERTLGRDDYDRAWRELLADGRMHAFAARIDGRLVGIAHFLTHASTSAPDVCYLQDLFTTPDARGQGVGKALIAEVTEWARTHGCSRVYWSTHHSNNVARRLYDQVAINQGFIRYQIEL